MVDLPNGKSVRLLLDQGGELAGLEVLGWWRRAHKPLEVQVVIEDRPAEAVGPDDPLAEALGRRGLSVSPADGRPLESGLAMIPMSEVAERTGLERSWQTREAAAGRLRARKIGREWWTTDGWIKACEEGRATRPRTGAKSAVKA